jgi:hypothetical protein
MKRKTLLLFWVLVAIFQLLFTAQIAPAKSIPGLKNCTWKIFVPTAQSHRFELAQVSLPQRVRPPPAINTAQEMCLAPGANAGTNLINNPGPRGFVITQDGPLISASRSNPDPFAAPLPASADPSTGAQLTIWQEWPDRGGFGRI